MAKVPHAMTHPHDSAAKPVTELKPCPACGGKLRGQYYDAFSCDSSFSYIGCDACDLAFVDTKWGDEGFVEHCNRRASPDGIGAGTVKDAALRVALSPAPGNCEVVAYASRNDLQRHAENPGEMFLCGSKGTFHPNDEVPLYTAPVSLYSRVEAAEARKPIDNASQE